jgi:hypothetical protein
VALLFGCLVQPLQIGETSVSDFNHDALGNVIAVEFTYRVTHGGKFVCPGFDEQQPFLGGLDFTFPTINRLDLGKDIHAGRESSFDQKVRDLVGFLFRSGRAEDDSFVSHIKSGVSNSGQLSALDRESLTFQGS